MFSFFFNFPPGTEIAGWESEAWTQRKHVSRSNVTALAKVFIFFSAYSRSLQNPKGATECKVTFSGSMNSCKRAFLPFPAVNNFVAQNLVFQKDLMCFLADWGLARNVHSYEWIEFIFFKGKKPPNPQTNKLAFTKIFVPVAESVQYYLQ